jgi:CheY-like chemotaxis protein
MLAYSGKGRFVIEPIDLNYLVRDLEHLLSASTSRRARLVFSLENTLPAVEADATQMRQIILNLVTNAAEAISSCDGEIVVTTGTTAVNEESTPPFIMDGELKPGAYVFLNVTDNGTGISEKTMQRIFDPFFTTKFTGRGLGLAAVLGIVRGHRGAIAVQTERGRGTSFTIYLPALPHRIDMVPTPLPIRQQAKSAGKILLVDDVSTVLAVGKRILEKEGFEVLIARHGREALDLFASEGHNIACVILDLTMPEMDGVETAVELWKKNPKLPIVLSSGYSEQESLDRFPAGMVAGFIPKPYQPHLLLDRVRQAIGPRQ